MTLEKMNPAAGGSADGVRDATRDAAQTHFSTAIAFSKRDRSPRWAAAADLTVSPERVAEIATRLFGEPNLRLSTARELRFGRQGSISVVPSRGVFTDHESGASGGILAMIVAGGGADTLAQAASRLAADGIIPSRETAEAKYARANRDATLREDRRTVAANLWRSGLRVKGTLAETYLRHREIKAPLEHADLAFLPAAPVFPYKPDHRLRPALISRVRDDDGRGIGCHVTYLAADGLGKADLPSPRKMVGRVGGGHVALIPGRWLVVAEGLESAFSAWDAATDSDGCLWGPLGAVAALSAAGMARFSWPSGTSGLLIAPDNDASGVGRRAGVELAKRAAHEGLAVAFFNPPSGCSDWNDAARIGGEG